MDIVVLCGGLSAERDVSISSGTMAAQALKNLGHRVVTLDLFLGYTPDKGGFDIEELFEVSHGFGNAAVAEDVPDLDMLRSTRPDGSRVGDNVFEICKAADIVFMALHGTDGEDGKIQGAFDLLGIRYTGTGSFGSALAMNKSVAKQIFEGRGIKTPGGNVLHRKEYSFIGAAGFPCVVKPCSGGSSVGTSIVESFDGFVAALDEAFRFDDAVIVEQYIKGRECDVGVIAGRTLPPIEIIPKSEFYDYKNKYQAGLALEICPADFPDEITKKLQSAAEAVYDALMLEVYARMDFVVDSDGEVWCLEANTLPGLTPTSLLPQEAAAVGIDYDGLVDLILRESLKKYGENV